MIYSSQRIANQFHYPLLDRWLELCKCIGAKGNIEHHKELYHRLVYYYNQPGRYYHALDHIHFCLIKFDEVKHLLSESVVVELAIWFHDAIYEFWTKPNENEEFSASLAVFFVHHLMGLPHKWGRRVAYLIENTRYFRNDDFRKDARLEMTHDGKYLVDIDLSSGLGGSESDFRKNGELVAKEFAWVEPGVFIKERLKILQMFHSLSPFYLTDYFRGRYEERTKANLKQGIRELEEQLLSPKALPQ